MPIISSSAGTSPRLEPMPRIRAALAALPLASLVLGGASGCSIDLPDPRLIISHRVLAIRTAVTTPLVPEDAELADQPKAQALPFETVTLEPFIVDESGAVDPDELDIVWIACELSISQSLFACIQDAMPLTLDALPACEAPSLADLQSLEDGLPELPSPCLIAREGSPEYVAPLSANVLLSGAVELTMIAGVPEGTDTDTCARELLAGEYDLPDDCLYAVQRLEVGPIEQLLVLAESFGAAIPGFEAPDPEDVPEADRNPRITEVRVGAINDQGQQIGNAQIVSAGDLVEVELGATLQVEVDSPEEDLQTYQVAVNNGESYEDRQETYEGDWYVTWGELLAGTSDDPQSYNQWTLEPNDQDEEDTPPEGRARMYYVVRDGRQGVNWFWFEIAAVDPEQGE
ncbi:hypothetical protein G6O69_17245 [Pseudenhygromyxa sp. WMMC2535]|uniref:hypothetical protein n=1 Tax=Pseudenhygromyxa sp. WMMC2535 TaxID=2712867 RepID=UPI001595EDD6|nr:hypothetical protein [Pseudenhygromyxa sp. WMMC2535]NVB39591.1 hypothetical protein [Pseudenhygromyxa sp. WMMC2535]